MGNAASKNAKEETPELLRPKTPEVLRPKTPEPTKTTTSIGKTPNSERVGSYHKDMGAQGLRDISPIMKHDIKDHLRCSIDDMLVWLLHRSSAERATTTPGLTIQEYLAKVEPVAAAIQGAVKEELEQYKKAAEGKDEKELYKPFVAIANKTLELLREDKEINDLGLLPPTDRVMFHVSDNKTIISIHGGDGATAYRKPDVVALSQETAGAFGEHNTIEEALASAGSPPKNAYHWEFLKHAVEFKCLSRGLNLKKVPTPKSSPTLVGLEYDTDKIPVDPLQADDDEMSDHTAVAEEEHHGPEVGEQLTDMEWKELERADSPNLSSSHIEQAPLAGSQTIRSEALSVQTASSVGIKRSNDDAPANSRLKRLKTDHVPSTEVDPGTSALRGSHFDHQAVPHNVSPYRKLHPTIQSALYATELLSAPRQFRNHAINLIIYGSVIYLWWYDRQGAVQSTGFDLLDDMPHFALLVLAMDRLPRDTMPGLRHILKDGDQDEKVVFKCEDKLFELGGEIAGHFGCIGRGCKVNDVWPAGERPIESRRPDTRSTKGKSLAEKAVNDGKKVKPSTITRARGKKTDDKPKQAPETTGYIAKFAHIQKARRSEDEIIKDARQKLENYTGPHAALVKKALRHLPDIIAAQDFGEEENTKEIRDYLNIGNKDSNEKGNRVLRVMVARKLIPIKDAPADKFEKIFWDCVECHWALWTVGVHHRDISISNLMYRVDKYGNYEGVPNDFDLSSEADRESISGTERTGTLPFMAIELLETPSLEGKGDHLYRHDLEAFLWVLIWRIFPHRQWDEKAKEWRYPFAEWTAGPERCRTHKKSILYDKRITTGTVTVEPEDDFRHLWPTARQWLKKVSKDSQDWDEEQMREQIDPYEELKGLMEFLKRPFDDDDVDVPAEEGDAVRIV